MADSGVSIDVTTFSMNHPNTTLHNARLHLVTMVRTCLGFGPAVQNMLAAGHVPAHTIDPGVLARAINCPTGWHTPPAALLERNRHKHSLASLVRLLIMLCRRLLAVLVAALAKDPTDRAPTTRFATDHTDALAWFTRQAARCDPIDERCAEAVKEHHAASAIETHKAAGGTGDQDQEFFHLDTTCSWIEAGTAWKPKGLVAQAKVTAAEFEVGSFRWVVCTPVAGPAVSGVCLRRNTTGKPPFAFIKGVTGDCDSGVQLSQCPQATLKWHRVLNHCTNAWHWLFGRSKEFWAESPPPQQRLF